MIKFSQLAVLLGNNGGQSAASQAVESVSWDPIVVKTRFTEIESASQKFSSWLQFLTNQTSANWLPFPTRLYCRVLIRQTTTCLTACTVNILILNRHNTCIYM